MEYTMQDKYARIRAAALAGEGTNPVAIVQDMMRGDYMSMHGPEHHYADGAAFLAAYANSGGELDLECALDDLALRTQRMPGAMCGMWGVCGSVTAVGAALSVIHGTGPLSTDAFYGEHMAFASRVLARMSEIGGARCCKRNAYLSLSEGAAFVRERYGIAMETDRIVCEHSARNAQCLGARCPFYGG